MGEDAASEEEGEKKGEGDPGDPREGLYGTGEVADGVGAETAGCPAVIGEGGGSTCASK